MIPIYKYPGTEAAERENGLHQWAILVKDKNKRQLNGTYISVDRQSNEGLSQEFASDTPYVWFPLILTATEILMKGKVQTNMFICSFVAWKDPSDLNFNLLPSERVPPWQSTPSSISRESCCIGKGEYLYHTSPASISPPVVIVTALSLIKLSC